MDRQEEALYFATHCASCGRKYSKYAWAPCGECMHPYRTPWGLWLHDWKVRIEMNWRKPKPYYSDEHVTIWDDMPRQKWKYRFKSLIPRRPGKIFCCPCCIHDL